MDFSDSNEKVNHALMTNVETKHVISEKVDDVIYNFDTNKCLS